MASRWRHDDVMTLTILEKQDFIDLDIWLKFEELRMMDFGYMLDTKKGGNKDKVRNKLDMIIRLLDELGGLFKDIYWTMAKWSIELE